MARTCINHKDVPSVTMCHQCHHPICKSCSIVMPLGTFCSTECSILNRDVKARLREGAPKGMGKLEGLIKIVAAFVLIFMLLYGIHMAAQRVPKLKKADVIGRLLDALHVRKD
jgi:hypothetical protein